MTSGRWKRAAGPAALVAVMSAVAGFWAWFHWAPPGTAFLTVNPDPEVPYLLTSLAVFKGQPYAFVQHPGAPLALVGTALLAPLRPFGGARDFVLSVLGRPGVFMLAVHALLLAATLLCMWRMARQAPPGGAQRVVLAAAFFSFLPGAFFWPAFWTHDAVAFPLGTLLLAAAWESVKRGRPPSARRALLLGAGAGTMTASGLSFAVWAVGLVLLPVVLAACARRRPLQALARALLVAGGAVLAFALWTLPLLGAAKLLALVSTIVARASIDGIAAAVLTSWQAWAANVGGLVVAAPALFIAVTAAALMALAGAWRARGAPLRRAGVRAMAAVLVLQAALLLLLLGTRPSVSYLPAAAALLPPLLAVAFAAGRGRPGLATRTAAYWAVLAGFAVNLAADVYGHRARLRLRTAMESAVSAVRARSGIPLLLWGPGLRDARCYALWMGDQHTGRALGSEISALCPNEGLAWSNLVALPQGHSVGERALLVTTEKAAAAFPSLRVPGAAEIVPLGERSGERLAFYRVAVGEGGVLQLAAAAPAP